MPATAAGRWVFNEAALLEQKEAEEATKQKIAVNYSYYRTPLTV